MACMQLALVRRHPPGPPRAVDQSWIEKEIQANVRALTCRQSRESATVGSDLRWAAANSRPTRSPKASSRAFALASSGTNEKLGLF